MYLLDNDLSTSADYIALSSELESDAEQIIQYSPSSDGWCAVVVVNWNDYPGDYTLECTSKEIPESTSTTTSSDTTETTTGSESMVQLLIVVGGIGGICVVLVLVVRMKNQRYDD